MNRIDERFKKLKGKTAFVSYLTAGDPSFEVSCELFINLAQNGVDILEVGIPFSDPLADGVVIQEASDRALSAGMNVRKVFDLIKAIRTQSEVPIVLFTYLNPVVQYGIEEFCKLAQQVGADGILFLDLPVEEAKSYKSILKKYSLHMIFLIAPTSTVERIQKISKLASGFIYYVSRTGVTGVRDQLAQGIQEKVQQIKSKIKLPVVVGFGISSPEHVRQVSAMADGFVVGSAFIRIIKENLDSQELIPKIQTFAKSLKQSVT